MKAILISLLLISCLLSSDLYKTISGNYFLFSYRQGGAVYGKYFFHHVHHCLNGNYIEYAQSVKMSVLGGENRYNWEDSGSWKVTMQNGIEGVLYINAQGKHEFVQMNLQADGSIFIPNNVSLVYKGKSQCY